MKKMQLEQHLKIIDELPDLKEWSVSILTNFSKLFMAMWQPLIIMLILMHIKPMDEIVWKDHMNCKEEKFYN